MFHFPCLEAGVGGPLEPLLVTAFDGEKQPLAELTCICAGKQALTSVVYTSTKLPNNSQVLFGYTFCDATSKMVVRRKQRQHHPCALGQPWTFALLHSPRSQSRRGHLRYTSLNSGQ